MRERFENYLTEGEKADRLGPAFLLALCEITGSRILRAFTQVLTLLFDQEHRKPFQNPAAVRRSVESHREMLRAVPDRDESRMRTLIEEHIHPLSIGRLP